MNHRPDLLLTSLQFDLELNSATAARAVQNRVSAFCGQRLASVLERSFADFGAGHALVIERLELDLGELPHDFLEDELARRLERALRDVLRGHFPPVSQPPVPPRFPKQGRGESAHPPESPSSLRSIPLPRWRLEKLAAFLEKGLWTWQEGRPHGPDAGLLALLNEAPEALLRLLRRIGSSENVRRRLAHEFSEAALQGVVRLMEPAHYGLILAYLRGVTRIQAQRPVVQDDQRNFRKTLWQFVLSFLLYDRGSHFNARSFVKTTLMRLAAHYRVSYHSLLAMLLARVETLRISPSERYTLPSILLSLNEEEQIGLAAEESPPAATLVEERYAEQYDDADVLAHWLHLGVLPGWSLARQSADLQPVLERLLEEAPEQLATLLDAVRRRPGAMARLSLCAGDALAWSLLQTLAPHEQATPAREFATLLQAGQQVRHLPGIDPPRFAATVRELMFDALAEGSAALHPASLVPRIRDGVARRYKLTAPALAEFWEAVAAEAGRRLPVTHPLVAAIRKAGDDLHSMTARMALAAEPVPAPPAAGESAGPAQQLEQWLLFGIPPQGLDSAGEREAWLRRLADADLAAALARLGPREQGVRRLAFQMPEFLFTRAVRLLAGAAADQVLAFRDAAEALGVRLDPPTNTPATFVHRVRECVLAYLLSEKREPFSLADLIRRILATLAARYAQSYRRLLEMLAELAGGGVLGRACRGLLEASGSPEEDVPNPDPVWLASIHSPSLREGGGGRGDAPESPDRDATAADEPPIPDDADEPVHEPLALLAAVAHPVQAAWLRYLQTGAVPSADAIHLLAAAATWFAQALAEPAFVAALRGLGERPEAVRRLLESLPPDQRFRLLEALAPDHAGFLRVFLELGAALAADATLSARQRRDCARIHWHIVLAGLLDADAPGFSVAGFLDDAGHRIAQRLGLPVGTYVERMLHQARPQAGGEPRFRPVADGLEALRPALPKPAAEVPQTAAPPSLQPRRAEESTGASEAELPLPGGGSLPALLRHFLQYGGPPAGEAELVPRELGQRLLLDLREQPAVYRALFQWAAGRELERLRLVTAFAPSVLAEVLSLLLPADGGAARQVLDGLAELAGRDAERWRRIAGGELLRSIALQRGRTWNAAEFFYALLQRLAAEFHLAPDRIGEHLSPLLLGRGDAARWLPALRQAVREWRLEMNAAAAAGAGPVSKPTASGAAGAGSSRPAGRTGEKKSAAAPANRTVWPMRGADSELPAAEPYFVDNAGLVLLWPFLPRYFQMLELTRGQAFRDATAQSRALYLLHFLATGAGDAPEHRLLLNKILCGLPTALPPEPQAPPTEAERNLSEELLYGVTRNWDKLRNTSIAGLREAFLQREGRLLKKDDDSWALTVSGKPYDMLLDSLPWSLSTIRLGWMPQVLFVQWR